MEYKLAELKEKIQEIRQFKDQINGEELEFFESCDFIVSRTNSYWELDHIQFGFLEFKIDSIKKKINNGKLLTMKKIKIKEYDEIANINDASKLKVKNVNVIHYNQKGQETQNDTLDKEGNISYSWINIYNENDVLIEKKNNSSSRYIMEYNEKGQKISERFSYNGNEENKREFKYDSQNNLILEIFTNGAAQVKTYYDYDANNNLIKKSLKQANGVCTTESHFKNGLLIQINHFEPDFGRPTGYTSYQYDEFNNAIKISKYFGMSDMLSTEKYEYNYDENKNWIRQIKTKDSGWLIITDREIEYFE